MEEKAGLVLITDQYRDKHPFFSVYLTLNEIMPDFRRRFHALENVVLVVRDGSWLGITSMPGCLNGGAFTLQRKTDAPNSGENWIHSFKHWIQENFLTPGCEGSIRDVIFETKSLVSLSLGLHQSGVHIARGKS